MFTFFTGSIDVGIFILDWAISKMFGFSKDCMSGGWGKRSQISRTNGFPNGDINPPCSDPASFSIQRFDQHPQSRNTVILSCSNSSQVPQPILLSSQLENLTTLPLATTTRGCNDIWYDALLNKNVPRLRMGCLIENVQGAKLTRWAARLWKPGSVTTLL